MKKTIISVVVVILFVVALVFLTNYDNPQGPIGLVPTPTTASSTNPITIVPVDVSIARDSYLAGISGSYPSFPQASDRFNTTIKNDVELGVSEFIKTANTDYEGRLNAEGDAFFEEFQSSGMYNYSVRYEVIQSNESFISVAISIEGYSGGAHGYHVVNTYNYDVAKDKTLGILDVYPVAGGITAIAELSRTELTQKFKDDGVYDEQFIGMMNEGTDPANAANFERFVFDGNNVYVYFTEYQVAPYVYGTTKIHLPLIQENNLQ